MTQYDGRDHGDDDALSPPMDFKSVIANMREPQEPRTPESKHKTLDTPNRRSKFKGLWDDDDKDKKAINAARKVIPIPGRKENANKKIAENKDRNKANRKKMHPKVGELMVTYGKDQTYCQYVDKKTSKKKLFFAVTRTMTQSHQELFKDLWTTSCTKGLSKEQVVALRDKKLAKA